MTTTDPWVAWLVSKIGTTEDPKGSNNTPIGVEFGWNYVAWCAETQSLAAFHAFGTKLFWSAAVAVVKQAAINGENGLQWIGKNDKIRVGDLPCFDFGGHGNSNNFHISGVVNPGTQAKFETIGGNESDRCQRQWRDRKYVMGFVRLPFTSVGLGAPPQQEEDELGAYDAQINSILAQLQAHGDELGKLATVIRGDGTPDDSLRAKCASLDAQIKEVRRNVRRIGKATNAQDIEGTA